MFCVKFGWLKTSGSGEENVNDGQTDDGQQKDDGQAIRKAHVSFQVILD